MSKDNRIISSVFDKEMSRKEFLKLSGAALVGLTGIGQLIKLGTSQNNKKTVTKGYGASAYGGSKKQG